MNGLAAVVSKFYADGNIEDTNDTSKVTHMNLQTLTKRKASNRVSRPTTKTLAVTHIST